MAAKSDYVSRMKMELKNLDDNRRKLKYFLQGPIGQKLPEDKSKLMHRQVEVMTEYKNILQARLELE